MGRGAVPTRWEVPLAVDGQSVTVKGTLDRQAAPSALPWFVLAAVMFLATLAGLARARRVTLVVVAAVGALAAAVSVAEAQALPGEAGGRWWLGALGVLAALGALAALVGRPAWLAGPCTAGAGVALVVWGWRPSRCSITPCCSPRCPMRSIGPRWPSPSAWAPAPRSPVWPR